MKVQFADRGGKVPPTLRAHVRTRIGLALGRFAQRIERVVVRFSESDGEKRCLIEVGMRAEMFRVEGQHGDVFAAADNAVARVSSSIDRALEREQNGDSRGPARISRLGPRS
jgi:ribosomal subunit interface protein